MSILKLIDDALIDGSSANILKFHDYTIEKRIDEGEQGRVYKIRNQIKKLLALKIYKPAALSSDILENRITQFNREVGILSTLEHRNIVNIFTAGSAA